MNRFSLCWLLILVGTVMNEKQLIENKLNQTDMGTVLKSAQLFQQDTYP